MVASINSRSSRSGDDERCCETAAATRGSGQRQTVCVRHSSRHPATARPALAAAAAAGVLTEAAGIRVSNVLQVRSIGALHEHAELRVGAEVHCRGEGGGAAVFESPCSSPLQPRTLPAWLAESPAGVSY